MIEYNTDIQINKMYFFKLSKIFVKKPKLKSISYKKENI